MDIPEETPYEETEVRHEIEVYDPDGMSKRYCKDQATASDTYTLYPNTDLKHLKDREIDLQRLRKLNPNIPELHMESMDTVMYRLKECVRTGGTTLDLSNLGLNQLPPHNKIPPSVKHLFLGNNNLHQDNTPDLTPFKRLKVLDICNNNFSIIPELPISTVEVSCRSNCIADITNLSKYRLKRLDISHNKLTQIPDLPLLEILVCVHNSIVKLGDLPSLKKLTVSDNKLTNLRKYMRLALLEADRNNLSRIDSCPNLVELYVNFNRLNCIDNLDKIKVIQINGNKVKKIPYFKTLKELMCNGKEVQEICKRYKIKEALQYKDETMLITFA